MNKLFHTANIYMILGLITGFYGREITHLNGFEGDTPLGTVHTHLLALGMLFFLIVLALEKLFTLSRSRLFTWFYLLYNGGLLLTVAVMVLRGTLTVFDAAWTGAADTALAWTAGLGHIVLSVGLILFFHALQHRIRTDRKHKAEAATA